MAHYIQANINGRLQPADEPAISPLDRGYLYGDAVYEVWRTHGGVVFAWEEHCARLERSANALGLVLAFGEGELWQEVARTAAAFRTASGFAGELYVRLQVSRGAGAIGLDPKLADRPGWVILVQPAPPPSAGLRLVIPRHLRRNPADCLDPAWKTGNYLNNLLGVGEARRRGGDDALFLNLAGHFTEASTASILFIAEGRAITPRLQDGILESITRALVISEVAPRLGLTVEERAVGPGELPRFAEVCLLSTTKDVAPVIAIDEFRWNPVPGPVTARLIDAWGGYVRERAAATPGRQV